MICPKCNAENGEGATFCLKCGEKMVDEEVKDAPKEETEGVKVEITPEPTIEMGSMTKPEEKEVKKAEEMVQKVKPNKPKKQIKIDFIGYFKSIYHVFLNPGTKMDEELNKYDELANSCIMGVLVAAIATILKLITTMISVVRVKSIFGDTSWNWDNLGNLNYFKEIGLNLLIFAGMIAVFAGVVYLAGLVVKRETQISRLVALATIALVPYLAVSYLIAPILNLIWYPLAKIAIIVSEVYTLLMLYDGLNKEIILEGNRKVIFNLTVFSILLSALFLVNYYTTMSDISSAISSIFS